MINYNLSDLSCIYYRSKVGITNDDPFYKYQVVSDSLVVALLQAAHEITGNCICAYTLYNYCYITLKALPWINY